MVACSTLPIATSPVFPGSAGQIHQIELPAGCEKRQLASSARLGEPTRWGAGSPKRYLISVIARPTIELTLMGYRVSGTASTFETVSFWRSIQEVRPVQRVPLRRLKPRITNNAAQLFFSSAVGHAGGANDVFFEHHRADVVAAEAQAHLADFQSLGNPAGLHIEKIREAQPRDGENFQIFNGGGFIPVTLAQRRICRLEASGVERRETAGLFLTIVEPLKLIDAGLIVFAHTAHQC